MTSTGKKQALTWPSSSTGEPSRVACCSDSHTDFQCKMKGLWLIDLGNLLASVSRRASCNVCGSLLTVREDLKLKKGICSRLSLSCTNLFCAGSDVAFCDTSKHLNALNSRFHLAGRMCGRGRAGLKAISWFLAFCPLTYRAFSEYNSPLHQIVQQSAINSQLVVPSQLHSLHDTEPKNVVDVTVMCDGTWSRREFTAMVVISWNSGHLVKERIHGNGCDIVEFRPGTAHYTKMLFYFIEGRCSAVKGSSTCIHLEYQILSYFSFFLHVHTGIENKRKS